MPVSYQIGDLVWAKLKGYSPWPGRISEPSSDMIQSKKGNNVYFVYFFGTNNYAWVSDQHIKPYQKYKDILIQFSKKTDFNNAVNKIEEYISNPDNFDFIGNHINEKKQKHGFTEDNIDSDVCERGDGAQNYVDQIFGCDSPKKDELDIDDKQANIMAEEHRDEHTHTIMDHSEYSKCNTLPNKNNRWCEYNTKMDSSDKENHFDDKKPERDGSPSLINNYFDSKIKITSDVPQNTSDTTPLFADADADVHLRRMLTAASATKCQHSSDEDEDKRDFWKQFTPKPVVVSVKVERIDVHQCRKCRSAYLDRDALEQHAISKHMHGARVLVVRSSMTSHVCPTCYQTFPNASLYRMHTIEHIRTNVRKRFLDMQYGEGSGQFVKRFKCEECDYKFVLESTLKEHMVVHKPKPYACHCGVAFYKRNDLKLHQVYVHITLKPCGRPRPKPFVPKINYNGPKPKQLVKYNNEQESDPTQASKSENETETKSGIRPRLKARLLTKSSKNTNKLVKKETTKYIRRTKSEIEILDTFKMNKDKRWVCPESSCDSTFASKGGLWVHYRNHTGERPYECDQCGKSFTQGGALKMHKLLHVGIKNFKCEQCDYSAVCKSRIDRHVVIHTGVRPYKCSYCEKSFNDQSAFGRHIRIHTGDKRYKCELCTKAFTDHSALYAHRKRHAGVKPFSCDICDKTFYTKSQCNAHAVAHDSVRSFECDKCSIKLKTKAALYVHIKKTHLCRQTYQCDHCLRYFNFKDNLQKHIRDVHATEKNKCQVCHATFFCKTDLESHSMGGTGCVPVNYECEICGNNYNNRSSYHAHIHRHKLQFKCDGCGAKCQNAETHRIKCVPVKRQCVPCGVVFYKLSEYTTHLKTHRPHYKCNECDTKYEHKVSLIYHISSKHNENELDLYCDRCMSRYCSEQDLQTHKTKCSGGRG